MTKPPHNVDDCKLSFIRAFFDDFSERVHYVKELNAGRRDIEATILCCAYIEAVGNNLYPSSKDSAANFSRALEEHGGDAFFAAIHPSFLADALPARNGVDKDALAGLRASLAPLDTKIWNKATFLGAIRSTVSSEVLSTIQKHIWRGSIANLAYVRVRSAMFKTGLGSTAITLSGQSYEGGVAPPLDFARLHAALVRLVTHVRDVSLETAKWYGTIG